MVGPSCVGSCVGSLALAGLLRVCVWACLPILFPVTGHDVATMEQGPRAAQQHSFQQVMRSSKLPLRLVRARDRATKLELHGARVFGPRCLRVWWQAHRVALLQGHRAALLHAGGECTPFLRGTAACRWLFGLPLMTTSSWSRLIVDQGGRGAVHAAVRRCRCAAVAWAFAMA